MFNGVVGNVDMQGRSVKDRYRGVTYTSAWGGQGAYDAFKAIDNLNPGDELDYETWQKLIYAAKLLAKHYDWFENVDPWSRDKKKPFVWMNWNPDTEEYEKSK